MDNPIKKCEWCGKQVNVLEDNSAAALNSKGEVVFVVCSNCFKEVAAILEGKKEKRKKRKEVGEESV